jgi:glycosyltransferase involved in cell wall biosynthesis
MRVLLDCRMASWSGVGRYTVGLTRALAARDDVELAIAVGRVIHNSPAAAEPILPPELARRVTAYVASSHPFSPAGAFDFGRIAREVAPDVTHCLHFPTPFPARRPLVVTMHDLSPLMVPGLMPSVVRRAVYRAWNKRAVRVASRIIVDAAFSVGEIERVFPNAAGRITPIAIAADDFSAGQPEPLAGMLGDLARQPYVLSMGSTRPHKDIPSLLTAFVRLAPAHRDLRLLLVGAADPVYLTTHLPAETPAAIRERVTFTGRVSDGQLRTLYAGAVVFAHPSLYEGFGLPPLEAMALGAPVVAVEAASLPEVVGEAALLVTPGDPVALAAAIERVLTEPILRDRLIAAGHVRAAELTWAATAEATVRVYREVIRDSSRLFSS